MTTNLIGNYKAKETSINSVQDVNFKKTNLAMIGDDVVAYQITKSPELKKKITNALSPYFKYYPKMSFRIFDEDLLSDFYLYVLERIDRILEKYQQQLSQFMTYLSLRLRTYWFNFVKHKKMNEKILLSYPLNDENLIKDPTENTLTFSDNQEEKTSQHDTFKYFFPFVKKLIHSKDKTGMATFRYLVLKLLFFDFFNADDFIVLKNYLKRPYGQVLVKINQFQIALNEKKNQQMKWEIRLNKIFHKMNSLSLNLASLPTDEKIILQNKMKKQQEKILDKYYQTKIEPAAKDIARVLEQEDERKINNVINYYKKVASKKPISKRKMENKNNVAYQ